MAKNIILILLFILLYGGIFLFGTKEEPITDRTGFGEFSENHYHCDACNFDIELKPEWLALDGTAIKGSYSDYELNDYFGPEESYDIITGFAHPHVYVECVRYNNYNMPSDAFTESYLYGELEFYKSNIESINGILGRHGVSVQQAKGNGEKMGIYYYDYTVDGEFVSEFNCFLNCGDDTLWFYGYYTNEEGFREMKELISERITFNSSSEQTV